MEEAKTDANATRVKTGPGVDVRDVASHLVLHHRFLRSLCGRLVGLPIFRGASLNQPNPRHSTERREARASWARSTSSSRALARRVLSRPKAHRLRAGRRSSLSTISCRRSTKPKSETCISSRASCTRWRTNIRRSLPSAASRTSTPASSWVSGSRGACTRDVMLGDVIFSRSVQNFMFESKVVPKKGGGNLLQPSANGDLAVGHALLDYANNFKSTHESRHSELGSWRKTRPRSSGPPRTCAAQRKKPGEQDRVTPRLDEVKLAGDEPAFVVGAIASGPSVAASTAYVAELRAIARDYAAIEMGGGRHCAGVHRARSTSTRGATFSCAASPTLPTRKVEASRRCRGASGGCSPSTTPRGCCGPCWKTPSS